MAIISIIALCNCHNPSAQIYNHEASAIALIIGIVIALLDLAKVIHMVIDTQSVDGWEIAAIIISIIVFCSWAEGEEYLIVSISSFAVSAVILEALRDILTAAFNANDGNGCPFV